MKKKIQIAAGIVILAVLAAVGATVIKDRIARETAEPVVNFEAIPESVLPLVSFYYEGSKLNETMGYAQALDQNLVRGTITPVAENKTIPAVIALRGSDVTAISFQIRTLGDGRLLEDTDVEGWSREEEEIHVELSLSTLVQQKTEYLLDLILTTETHGEVHYYTRIQWDSHESILQLIDFAKEYSRATFEKDADVLVPYMQNQTPKTEDSLAYVDLNSRYALLTWGNYAPVRTDDYAISVKELGEEQISLSLNYPVEITETDGSRSSYTAEEFYCLRMRSNQVYILKYDRTMEETRLPEQMTIENGRINLGMLSAAPQTLSSEKGSYTAFVAEKRLWLFEKETQTIRLLYSDVDTGNEMYDIQMVSVQEDGTTAFAVYGYVGRGEAEGSNQLCWYEYETETDALTKQLSIPLSRTYEFLNGEQNLSIYGNDAGEFYIRLDAGIYCIKPDAEEPVTISERVRGEAFLQSAGGNRMAWQEGEMEPICVLDMDTGVIRRIEAEEGQFVCMQGLNGNDLVYGIGRLSDEGTMEDGSSVRPLYALVIVNEEGETIHRYEKEGYEIVGTSIETGRILIERVQKNTDGTYRQAERDILLSSDAQESDAYAAVTSAGDGSYRSDFVIRMKNAASGSAAGESSLPRLVSKDPRTIVLSEQTILSGTYQVYAGGGLRMETDDLVEAIRRAFDEAGTVTGENLFVYWFRSSRKNYVLLPYENRLSSAADENLLNCMEVMTQVIGGNPDRVRDAWQESADVVRTLESVCGGEILDLQGCEIAQVLYYVDEGSPVLIRTGSRSAVLLVGYSGNQVMLYNSSKELETVSQTDLQAMLEQTNAPIYAQIKTE